MQIFSSLALDGGDLSASRPGRFTLMERAPATYCFVDWAILISLDAVRKRITSMTLQ
jgi:hypothetical protein